MQNKTENTEVKNDTNPWGQAILSAKRSLIKPYSKVKEVLKRKQFNLFLFHSILKQVFVHEHLMIHILS
jgi:hypothetical protein